MQSIHGEGTDVTFFIKSDVSAANELLPVHNDAAVTAYRTASCCSRGDWTDRRFVFGTAIPDIDRNTCMPTAGNENGSSDGGEKTSG